MNFLDIVENGFASDRNPHKIGFLVRVRRKTVELTDGDGNFWEVQKGDHLKVVGNLLKSALKEPVPQAPESTEYAQ